MKHTPVIKLYGADRCHKTKHYQKLLHSIETPYQFLDVEKHYEHANELRSLYANRKLNFPTITIDNKRLRNPSDEVLLKWINHFKFEH